MTARQAHYLRCDAPRCGALSAFSSALGALTIVFEKAKTDGWYVGGRGVNVTLWPPRDYCPQHAHLGRRQEVRGRSRGKGCNDATSVDGDAVGSARSGSSMRRSRRQ